MAASFPRAAIVSARIAKAPAKKRPSGYWLYFKSRASNGAQYVRGLWQSEIVAVAYLLEADRRGWIRPRWFDNTVIAAGGSERFDSGSSLSLSGPFWASGKVEPATEEELRALVARGAAEAGVTLEAVEFGRPLGRVAVQISVVTADPRGFLASRGEKLAQIVGPIAAPADRAPARAEGTLLEVRDERGRWVTASGSSARLGSGTGWSNSLFAPK